jgi:multidrug transporter EmrE-like cation transporter
MPRSAAAALLFTMFTACSAGGLLLFKRGWPAFARAISVGEWWSRSVLMPAAGAGLYAASFIIWLIIVSRLPLTIAYPVAIGLSLVAITFGAIVWLGEPLTAMRLGGATLIAIGIVLIVR